MFILEILLRFKAKQGNVPCAFHHGDLEPAEEDPLWTLSESMSILEVYYQKAQSLRIEIIQA